MLKKRLKSFKYAFQGVIELVRSQPNMWIHLLAAVAVVIAGFILSVTQIEWVLLVLCISLVLTAEAFNTALEYLTDLVSPDYHPLAGKVKDVAAAGVLIISIGAAIIGLIIFVPKL